MKHKILMKSAVSCSIELIDDFESPYFRHHNYDVYVNDKKCYEHIKTNVFTLHNLIPGTTNIVNIITTDFSYEIKIETESVSETIEINPLDQSDHTEIIQSAIDRVLDNGLIIINEGIYHVKPLFLKSNITILLKGTLLGSTNRFDYPILDEYLDNLPLGTWEGNVKKMFASLITGIRVSNVKLVGPGSINGNASNANWWINPKVTTPAARPRTIYLNYCNNIQIAGIKVENSPSWTIHPYYSDQLKFIDLKIANPKDSPNTDGCNPESCHEVEIIGCRFSVGDDCIAIKSGKMEMVEKFYRPSSNITIRNCLMENGHGAVVLGSESSGGIRDLDVSNCIFINTDRGLRIKTRRGRGNKTVIDGIVFKNITMKRVLNPFVINMFYFCDEEGKTDYVQSKLKAPVDERTPYIGKFTFQNITCDESIISAGFFYGLPEAKIEKIVFKNVTISMADTNEFGFPAMINDIEKVNRLGLYFNNVKEIVLNNIIVQNQIGPEIIAHNVDIIKK